MRWVVAGWMFVVALGIGAALGQFIRERAQPRIHRPERLPAFEWQLPFGANRSCIRQGFGGLDETLPLDARLEAGLRMLEQYRAMARFVHEEDRVHFDADGPHARLIRIDPDTCEIEVDGSEEMDLDWDFLVRWQARQIQFEVIRIEGDRVLGRKRAARGLADPLDPARGVLLLRPTYQRPAPRRETSAPLQFERRLIRALEEMARATNEGFLRYPMDPPRGFLVSDPTLPETTILTVVESEPGQLRIVLSVGRRDGVYSGIEYKISRGSQFVGFALVTRAGTFHSVAEFDLENTGSGAPPQVGDRCYGN